jgi:hypothetical protein
MEKAMRYPMPGERWKHYKGGVYEIITLANHSENQEALVVYKSIPFGSVYARPLAMWEDECELGRIKFKRFEIIE